MEENLNKDEIKSDIDLKLNEIDVNIKQLRKSIADISEKKETNAKLSLRTTILIAMIPLFGIVISSIFQQSSQTKLAVQRFDFDTTLEARRLKSDLILKAVDLKNPDDVSKMLLFLVNTHLIEDRDSSLRRIANNPSELPFSGFNVDPADLPTVLVTNITKDGGCEAGFGDGCWKTSITAAPGDIIAVQLYFHNNGSIRADDVILRLLPKISSPDTSHIFVGTIQSSTIIPSSGYSTVSISDSRSISFIPGTLRFYVHGEKIGYSAPNEIDIFNTSGFNIGAVSPGRKTEGSVIAHFKVSN